MYTATELEKGLVFVPRFATFACLLKSVELLLPHTAAMILSAMHILCLLLVIVDCYLAELIFELVNFL